MSYDLTPDKVLLLNMVTEDSIAVQYNPEQLKEQIGVSYADLTVPGNSHKRSHFINTENVNYTFDLQYRAIGKGPAEYARIQRARLFLKALAHPWKSNAITRGGAPRVLFVWPELVSLTCKIKSLEFTYTNFRLTGGPIAFTVAVVLEEVRDVFVSMDDILEQGDQRVPLAVRDEGEL